MIAAVMAATLNQQKRGLNVWPAINQQQNTNNQPTAKRRCFFSTSTNSKKVLVLLNKTNAADQKKWAIMSVRYKMVRRQLLLTKRAMQ